MESIPDLRAARLPLFCDIALAGRIERAEAQLMANVSVAAHRRQASLAGFVLPIAGGVATFAEAGSPYNKVAGLGFGVPSWSSDPEPRAEGRRTWPPGDREDDRMPARRFPAGTRTAHGLGGSEKRKLTMSEVTFVVSEADNGLRERLDQDIDAFNTEVTGHHDGTLLCIAVRDDGDLRAGLFGWTWGGCGYIDLLRGVPQTLDRGSTVGAGSPGVLRAVAADPRS